MKETATGKTPGQGMMAGFCAAKNQQFGRRMVRMRKLLGLLVAAASAVLFASPSFAQSQQQDSPPSTQGQQGSTPQAQQGSSNPSQAQQGSSAPAQTPQQNPPAAQAKKENPPARGRKKRAPSGNMPAIELAAGPNFQRATAPQGYYLDMFGWTVSGQYNLFRWLSGEAQGSGEYSHKALIGSTQTYSILFGPDFFPLKHHKITPWGHFLFGQAYYRNSIPAFADFPAHVNSAFSFAWEGGAGLDVNYKRRWGIRLLEFDYISTNFFGGQPMQPRQSNYRIEVGVIYKIGQR